MSKVKSVYLIGIGGIGMSAIARYFNDQGATVSGYDKTESPLTKLLSSEGIKIRFTENLELIPKNIDLVVYTPAIPSEHLELNFYLENNYLVLKRAQVLGSIVNEGDCFAVAGSHGKSTTSAMLAHVFQYSGNQTTAFLGAIAANYKSNYISGNAKSFVVEADEYDRSFHQIEPTATIVTSIDSDHLDIYGSLSGVQEGFKIYLSKMRNNGKVFIQHQQICPELPQTIKKYTYGINHGDYQAKNIEKKHGYYLFDVVSNNTEISAIQLNMGGLYNIENATAVVAMATEYGVSAKNIKDAFQSFKGFYRRFETILSNNKVTFIDDYAHHPNEIRAFIQGVKEFYPNKTITAIFQPHLYSRTKDYATHFAESLDLVDRAIMLPIYPARELPITGVSSELITTQMNKNASVVSKTELLNEIKNLKTDILVTIGAGDIARLINPIKEILQKN